MTEIDKSTTATPAPPPVAVPAPPKPEPHLMSPPPKKIELDQRSQSSTSNSANGGAGGGGGGGGQGGGPGPSGNSGGPRRRVRKRRHRSRRNGRQGYKPYHKLSFEEQKELDSKETARAEQRRAAQFSHGRAMAPYNTTQFIMEDLEARNLEPDVASLVEKLNDRCGSRERTYSGTGSFESGSQRGSWASPSDDDDSFDLDAEFDEQYRTVHVERLESLTKSELVDEVISLEADVSRSQVETKELRQMVQRLRADNYQLRKTLREAGLAEVRPNSAPPPPPPAPAQPAPADGPAPPADPDHAVDTDTSSSRPDEAPQS